MKRIFSWSLLALLLVMSLSVLGMAQGLPDSVGTGNGGDPTPLPIPVQNAIATVMGVAATFIVMGIKLIAKKYNWELTGNNVKLLVAVVAGILTIVVFIVAHVFASIHGFWNYVLAIVANAAIIIGTAELLYGQLINRVWGKAASAK